MQKSHFLLKLFLYAFNRFFLHMIKHDVFNLKSNKNFSFNHWGKNFLNSVKFLSNGWRSNEIFKIMKLFLKSFRSFQCKKPFPIKSVFVCVKYILFIHMVKHDVFSLKRNKNFLFQALRQNFSECSKISFKRLTL